MLVGIGMQSGGGRWESVGWDLAGRAAEVAEEIFFWEFDTERSGGRCKNVGWDLAYIVAKADG